MKPRLGRVLRAGFSFFAIRASDAESVLVFTMAPLEFSPPTSASTHPLMISPLSATQADRRTRGPAPTVRWAHCPFAATFLPAHAASCSVISERCDTEYISAANEDTATASSR